MTNYDGRCRGGWAFGQGFDSPQVHRKRGLRVYSQASFSMDLGASDLVGRRVRISAGGAAPQWGASSADRAGRRDRLPDSFCLLEVEYVLN